MERRVKLHSTRFTEFSAFSDDEAEILQGAPPTGDACTGQLCNAMGALQLPARLDTRGP